MKIQWHLLFTCIVFILVSCNGTIHGYDQTQMALNFDALYPESLSTRVVRLARHIWSDCIHLSDSTQQDDERIVRDIMAFYLGFCSLKESKTYYDQDLYYIADLMTMLHKRYIVEIEHDDSMQVVAMLFNRCLQQVINCVLEHDAAF